MAMNESGPKQEALWEQKESQEKLAQKKFEDIFIRARNLWNKIHDYNWEQVYTFKIQKKDGTNWEFCVSESNYGNKSMSINWEEKWWHSHYELSYRWWWYDLLTGMDNNRPPFDKLDRNIVEDLTPEEILTNVLPNFESRLIVAEKLKEKEEEQKKRERQQQIKNASQFAEVQERESNESMMDQALSNPDLRTSMG